MNDSIDYPESFEMSEAIYEQLKTPSSIIKHYFLSARPEDLPYCEE